MALVGNIEFGRGVRAVAVCLLALVALVVASPDARAATVTHGLRATYYDDAAFREPVLTRVDPRIAFSWKYASPSLAALASAARSSYWYDDLGDSNPATGTLHLKLNSVGADWDELVVE